MNPGDRVTKGYDDDGDGDRDPYRRPDQMILHSGYLRALVCAKASAEVRGMLAWNGAIV